MEDIAEKVEMKHRKLSLDRYVKNVGLLIYLICHREFVLSNKCLDLCRSHKLVELPKGKRFLFSFCEFFWLTVKVPCRLLPHVSEYFT